MRNQNHAEERQQSYSRRECGQGSRSQALAQWCPVASFSLATNERFKDRNDQWRDRTEWHGIVAWQRLAEIVGEYVRKGTKLYIEGRLRTSSWEDRHNGETKYRTEIVARDIVLLGCRDESQVAESSNDESETKAAVVDDDIPF